MEFLDPKVTLGVTFVHSDGCKRRCVRTPFTGNKLYVKEDFVY